MLSKYLLPRLNPYALLGEFSALIALVAVILVEQRYVYCTFLTIQFSTSVMLIHLILAIPFVGIFVNNGVHVSEFRHFWTYFVVGDNFLK